MADEQDNIDNQDERTKVADHLEIRAKEALERGLDFVRLAGGDPDSATVDFEKAGALKAAAMLIREG